MKQLLAALVLALVLSGCGAGGSGTAEGGGRDLSDFKVAQSVVQESVDVLSSSDIGKGSEGLNLLKSALQEDSATDTWCSSVSAGVDALEFARFGAQARGLQDAAKAQGC